MVEIRDAIRSDVPAITALYNSYVENSVITFDIEPVAVTDRYPWFEQFAPGSRHQLLVATEGDSLVGFAYTGTFRQRAAYDQSVESTIYLADSHHGQGIGTTLYTALFDAIAQTDVHRVYAGITLPNDASIAIHQKFGFTSVGVFTDAGYKFGKFWDVIFLEKKYE